MRTDQMIKSNYISKAEVKAAGALILTIVDCTLEKVGSDDKWILWFNEHPKGLSLNNTKIKLLEAAYGDDSDYWRSYKVKLTFDPTVMMSGQVVGGIKLSTSAAGRGALARGGSPGPAAPPGAPPPPVWNAAENRWVFPNPPPASAPAPANRPPPPVWNAATGQWDIVDTSTGEVSGAVSAPAAAPHQRPPTISERVNAGQPPAGDDGWSQVAPTGKERHQGEDFNDDIPF